MNQVVFHFHGNSRNWNSPLHGLSPFDANELLRKKADMKQTNEQTTRTTRTCATPSPG